MLTVIFGTLRVISQEKIEYVLEEEQKAPAVLTTRTSSDEIVMNCEGRNWKPTHLMCLSSVMTCSKNVSLRGINAILSTSRLDLCCISTTLHPLKEYTKRLYRNRKKSLLKNSLRLNKLCPAIIPKSQSSYDVHDIELEVFECN